MNFIHCIVYIFIVKEEVEEEQQKLYLTIIM